MHELCAIDKHRAGGEMTGAAISGWRVIFNMGGAAGRNYVSILETFK